MLCFLGLLVLASLALVSARYRPLAREAFDCVFRRVTLRKCTTGLDKRLKAMITGRLVASHPGAARFLHRHLEALAGLFVVLVVGSTANLGYGFYNYYRYERKVPEDQPHLARMLPHDLSDHRLARTGVWAGVGTELDDREARTRGTEGRVASVTGPHGLTAMAGDDAAVAAVLARRIEHAEPRARGPVAVSDGLDTLRARIAIGCEDPSSETVRRPAAPAGALGDHAGATRAAIAADCAGAQGRFWEYHQRLAANPDAIATCGGLIELARGLDVDEAAFARCLEDLAMQEHVRRDFEDGVKAGIYGTPTFFIDGSPVVTSLAGGARRRRGPGARSAPPVSLDPHRLRPDFPPLRDGRLVYFDNACMALRPQAVIDAVTGYYAEYPACGERSLHRLGRRVDEEVSRAREAARRFLHARRIEEIVFTQNTTHAINLVAHSFPFAPGDVVVTSDQEHNSNLLPWQQRSRHGVEHRAVAFGDLGALRAALTPAVKFVSMVMTSNLDGASIDARRAVEVAHEAGIPILLDAAQAAPHQEIDVRSLTRMGSRGPCAYPSTCTTPRRRWRRSSKRSRRCTRCSPERFASRSSGLAPRCTW